METSRHVHAQTCANIHEHVNTTTPSLSEQEKHKLCDVLYAHAHMFDNRKIGTARTPDGALATHYIYTEPNTYPVKQRPYHHNLYIKEIVNKQIDEWLV